MRNKGKQHAVTAKSIANLKPLKGDERSAAIRRAGGLARARQLAERKAMRNWAIELRDFPAVDSNYPGLSNGCACVLAMYQAAENGHVGAAEFLARLMGEMKTTVAMEMPVLRDDIPRAPDPVD